MKLTVFFVGLSVILPATAGQDAIFSTGFESSYTVGGDITGLTSLGENVEIYLNGQLQLTVSSDGPYATIDDIEAGQIFDLTIDNNNCTVMNGSGMMPNNAVTNADIDCPLAFTTVYDIKQGIATGDVALQNMLVTACRDNAGYNLQTVPADIDYNGDDFSAVYVFDDTIDCLAIQTGDRVDINPGTVSEFIGEIQLQNATYAIQSSGNPLPTPVLTTAASLDVIGAHPLNAVLVEVQNVTVSSLDAANFEYKVDTTLTIGDRHYLTSFFPEVGEGMSYIRGPLAYNFNLNKIDPTSALDLGRVSRLVINEVDYDQPAADDDEFLEIYNHGPGAADLSNLAIVLVNGNGTLYHSEPLAILETLGAGEYMVFGDPNVTNNLPSGTASITMPVPINIQNGVEGIALVNSVDEVLLDALSYEGEVTNADVGFTNPVNLVEGTATIIEDNTDGSLVRIPNGQDTDDAASDWQFSTTPTPGSNNNIVNSDSLVINEVDYDQPSTDTTEFIELYNPSALTIDLSQVAVVLVNGSNSTEYDRIELSGILEPNEFVVVANPAVDVPSGVLTFNLNSLQNGPDGIALVNTINTTLIDALSYESSITAAIITGFGSTVSLVEGNPTTATDTDTGPISIIRSPTDGSDTGDDATDFVNSANPTPGEPNTL